MPRDGSLAAILELYVAAGDSPGRSKSQQLPDTGKPSPSKRRIGFSQRYSNTFRLRSSLNLDLEELSSP